MMQRYYVGIQLPEDIHDHIVAAQELLFDEKQYLRPLEPHITLLPPPAVATTDPEVLIAAIREHTSTLLPFTITLEYIEWFKKQALAIKVNGKGIYHLQKGLTLLLPQDVEPLYYPNPVFSPHVTLAQALRGKTIPDSLEKDYAKQLNDALPYHFTVTRLAIYRSIGPRRYQAEFI